MYSQFLLSICALIVLEVALGGKQGKHKMVHVVKEDNFTAGINLTTTTPTTLTTPSILASPVAISGYSLALSTNSEDFVSQNKMIIAKQIKNLQFQLDEFKNHHSNEIKMFEIYRNVLKTKIQESDNAINPLIIINEYTRYCVDKYRTKLPHIDSLLQTAEACLQKGNNRLLAIVAIPQFAVNALTNYYTNNFTNEVNNCREKHSTNQTESNYILCIRNAADVAEIVVANYTATFNTDMKKAECDIQYYVQETFDCSFMLLFNTVTVLNKTIADIHDCIDGKNMSDMSELDNIMKGIMRSDLQ